MVYLKHPVVYYKCIECVLIYQPDGDNEDIYLVPKDDWELIVSKCEDVGIDVEETYEKSYVFFEDYNELKESIELVYEVKL